jgi:hypothetical protein
MWGNDHMKLTHLSRFRAGPPTAVKCFVHHIVDEVQPSHSAKLQTGLEPVFFFG